MPRSTARTRQPHASEPIRSSVEAIAVISLAIHRPLEAETIAFFLDEVGCSNTITVVSGTTDPDSVSTVAECMALAASQLPGLCGLVLASVRPASEPDLRSSPRATLPGDLDRWIEANEITETYGIELVEWFVIGPSGVDCPRELLGEAERW